MYDKKTSDELADMIQIALDTSTGYLQDERVSLFTEAISRLRTSHNDEPEVHYIDRCGCGAAPIRHHDTREPLEKHRLRCPECGRETAYRRTMEAAVHEWNVEQKMIPHLIHCILPSDLTPHQKTDLVEMLSYTLTQYRGEYNGVTLEGDK